MDADQRRYGRLSTIDDLEAIDDELHRYELIEGELVVTPPPGEWHQDVVFELIRELMEPCDRRGLVLRDNRGVFFDDGTTIVPDLVVYRPGPPIRELYLAPHQVALAVEVVSRSSQRQDRFTKPALLAAHRVPLYLVIDPFPKSTIVTLHRLTRHDYEVVARVEPGEPLYLPEPFDLEIDTTSLA